MFGHQVEGSRQEEGQVAGADGRDELEDGADVLYYLESAIRLDSGVGRMIELLINEVVCLLSEAGIAR